jgi:hypothetical protein
MTTVHPPFPMTEMFSAGRAGVHDAQGRVRRLASRTGAGFLLAAAVASGAAVLSPSWSAGSAGSAQPAGAADAPEAPRATMQSMLSNGVVESIRELPDIDESRTRRFQMTIRMRDGTLRVSDETGQARWQAGDGVRLFGPALSLP